MASALSTVGKPLICKGDCRTPPCGGAFLLQTKSRRALVQSAPVFC